MAFWRSLANRVQGGKRLGFTGGGAPRARGGRDGAIGADALPSAEESYRSLFENASDGIFQSSPEGRYLRVNPALARIYGYDSPQELIASLTDIATQLYVDTRRRGEFTRLLLENGVVNDFESRVYRKDRSIIWIRESACAVRDEHNRVIRFEGMVSDITQHKRFEETIQWQSYHDTLTGLPNRELIQLLLEEEILRARDEGTQGAVLFLDLDDFKHINDSLGHDVGDRLLKRVAGILSGCLRTEDVLARMGGDEFTAMISGIGREADAAATAQRMLDALVEPIRVDEHELYLEASIGVSLFPRDGDAAGMLLKNADIALYRAKGQGGRRYRVFSREMREQANQRLALGSSLRRAIDAGELRVVYQPQVNLESGAVDGVEALVRWDHPEIGALSPTVFIPLAEEMGLIGALGAWVLEMACRQAVEWRRQGHPIRLSVNLSARQFRQHNLATEVQEVLGRTGLPADGLELELTESAFIENERETAMVLQHLKALGVRLAIDDFGTGYSALAYLRRYPMDVLKIDQSFMRTLSEGSAEEAVIRAIIGVADALGLEVVAEGVETESQRRCVHRLGCVRMQGYLFSRPVPPDEIPPLLHGGAPGPTHLRLV